MAYKIQIPLGRENGSTLQPEEALSIANDKLEQLRLNGCLKGDSIESIIEDVDIKNANDKLGYIIVHLADGCLIDASKLAVIGSALQTFEFDDIADLGDAAKNVKTFSVKGLGIQITPTDKEVEAIKKSFSMASIQERLRINKKDVRIRLRYIIMDYRRFVKANAKKLASDEKMYDDLKRCFFADMNQLLIEILPYVSEENKQIAQLIGVNAVAPSMMKVCRELTLEYKKSMRILKAQGFLPKVRYQKLKDLYNEFMQEVANTVFKATDDAVGQPEIENVEEAEEVSK